MLLICPGCHPDEPLSAGVIGFCRDHTSEKRPTTVSVRCPRCVTEGAAKIVSFEDSHWTHGARVTCIRCPNCQLDREMSREPADPR